VTPSSCPRDLPVTARYAMQCRTTRACDGRVTGLRLLRFRDASVPHVSLHAIIPKRVATIHQGTACDEGRTAAVQLQDLRRRNCGRETDRAESTSLSLSLSLRAEAKTPRVRRTPSSRAIDPRTCAQFRCFCGMPLHKPVTKMPFSTRPAPACRQLASIQFMATHNAKDTDLQASLSLPQRRTKTITDATRQHPPEEPEAGGVGLRNSENFNTQLSSRGFAHVDRPLLRVPSADDEKIAHLLSSAVKSGSARPERTIAPPGSSPCRSRVP
jgi:hypothetical protein